MNTVVLILVLLLAVVASSAVQRATKLPLPFVQIAFGAVIAISAIPTVELDPELFFLLFLPPLLFLDGWRIPKDDLFRDRAIVLELAVGLVGLTVVGLGWFIHWMIPVLPLPVAFALAAVISPTDPIAVSAITARVPIPKRLMHILEGEALLNDASGLVCMRFAVAAMLTGAFSVQHALMTFLWLALGGAAIGVAVTILAAKAKQLISAKLGEDISSQILISLLIPFGAYMLAEELHASGILAAVAAGVAMGFTELSGEILAVTRVRRAGVWDTVQFAANGVIFVLLGEQMPGLLSQADHTVQATGHPGWWRLALYVLAINAALAVLRFTWVWTSLKLTLFRAARRQEPAPKVDLRLVAATSIAGVRGAVTLAGVLTLPLTLANGAPFPGRDLAIFLAAGVILVSLLVANIGLPPLLKDLALPPEPLDQRAEDEARVAAAQAAIRAIERAQRALPASAADAELSTQTAARLMDAYRQRIEARRTPMEPNRRDRQADTVERRLRLAALKAERDEIFRRGRHMELGDEQVRKLVRELDLLEARYGPEA